MKEQDFTKRILESRIRYYETITYTLLALAALCILTLAGTFYFPAHPEKEITTLFISLTSGLFGALVTIITQAIQRAQKLQSDEELQEEVIKPKEELPVEKPPILP